MSETKRVPVWFSDKLDGALVPFVNDGTIMWEREEAVRAAILSLAGELVEWMSNCDDTDFHEAIRG